MDLPTRYQLSKQIVEMANHDVSQDNQNFQEAVDIKNGIMKFLENYTTTNAIIMTALDLALYQVASQIRDKVFKLNTLE